MSWTVQADEDVEPLPAAVEVAAYRIVLEAVNNALRHGDAQRVHGDAAPSVRRPRGGGPRRRRRPRRRTWMVGRRARVDAGAGRGARGHVHGDVEPPARDADPRNPATHRLDRRREREVVMEQLRIMVVDDHDEFRHGLEALLASNDATEVVGCGGQRGRRGADRPRAATRRGADGPAHAEAQRDRGDRADRAVLTAHRRAGADDDGGRGVGVRGDPAGARGYLLKGARRSEILRSIEAVGAGEVIFGPAIAERVTTYFRGVQAPAAPELFPELTERERHVLRLIALGTRQRRDRPRAPSLGQDDPQPLEQHLRQAPRRAPGAGDRAGARRRARVTAGRSVSRGSPCRGGRRRGCRQRGGAPGPRPRR